MNDELKQEIIALIKEEQCKDYIEIGNSKTGTVKVSLDFNRPEAAEAKLKEAIRILKDNRDEVLINASI